MKPELRWWLLLLTACGGSGSAKLPTWEDSGTPSVPDRTDTADTEPIEDTDSADSGDTAEDTGEEPEPDEWVALPNSCAPPPADGTDAFVEVGSEINQTRPWFTEILDVAYLPDIDVVLTAGQGGVAVFDLSDPTQPDTRGHLGADPGPFERYYHVEPADPDRMYATHRDVGVHILTYENRDVLQQVVRADGSGYEGMRRMGDRLYVANVYGSLDVFDVSEADSLEWVAATETGLERPWDVVVDDSVAYVADGGAGLVVVSLADPDAPSVVSALPSDGQPVRLVQDADGYLYVAASSGGLEIYETSDPLAPTLVSRLDAGGSALDVEVYDGLAVVTTQEAVVLFDVGRAGTPEAPIPFAYEETELYAMALTAADGHWIVGDWNILSVWETGPDPAPAIDVSIDFIAFLDEAETREFTVTNRGSSDLDLAGIALPPGIEALVRPASVVPGGTATVAVTWDGTTDLACGSTLCIASDDPDTPEFLIKVGAGADGEGKAIGQNAPDFALADLDGTIHRLSDQLGHPVVLAYFATW